MNRRIGCIIILLSMIVSVSAFSQMKKSGLGGGIGFGGIFGDTEVDDDAGRFQARAFLRYGLFQYVEGEFGVGLGKIAGENYEAMLIPIDYRFLFSPLNDPDWNPYLYAGAGALHFSTERTPLLASPNEIKEWTAFVPLGIGMQFPAGKDVFFEISGGYNLTFTDDINAVATDSKNDNYWSFLVGLTTTGFGTDPDPDKDGLTTDIEKQIGTNPNVADTDGDGLSDGEEINQYRTDAKNVDSDGDGLKDGEEVRQYRTDPNKADTDGDGLKDGEELQKYNTDPLKADTDGDGLKDGDEVQRYKTNPSKADTDNGSVNDGTEVSRGSDPLNSADDVPPKPVERKEELKSEVGKSIVLEGIVFKTGSADIGPESEEILEKVYNTLEQNPELEVEIQGYTDNVGKQSSNIKLSQRRADAVKDYLVNKGISSSRITTKGYGPERPIAPNTTSEGRQQNRRIEFYRTK